MPQPKKFTMRLPKFCLKKRTRTCEFKTFWTKAVLQEARFTHITKRKRNCSNPYVRPYSGTSFPTRLQRKKPRFFKILHIRLQALYHAHFLSLARRKNACSRHFAFAKQGHFPQLPARRAERICNRLRRKQFRNGQKPTQVLESQFDNRKFRFACGILGRNVLCRYPRTPNGIFFDYERVNNLVNERAEIENFYLGSFKFYKSAYSTWISFIKTSFPRTK